jgi:hypothetical protein
MRMVLAFSEAVSERRVVIFLRISVLRWRLRRRPAMQLRRFR